MSEPILVAAYLVAGTIDAVAMDMTYMKASTLGKRLFSATACLYLWPLWLSIGAARFLGETYVAKTKEPLAHTLVQQDYWIATKSHLVCPRCEWQSMAQALAGRKVTDGRKERQRLRGEGWYLTVDALPNSAPVFRKPCAEHEEKVRETDDKSMSGGGYA